MYFCVLCIVCFVTFPVLFVCICVLNSCHQMATQLQLNISYHFISYHMIRKILLYMQIYIVRYSCIYASSLAICRCSLSSVEEWISCQLVCHIEAHFKWILYSRSWSFCLYIYIYIFACSDCGFESHWGHGCLYVVCCVLSGRGLCDELITRPEESYRLWSVVVCDIGTSRMRRPWPTGGLLHQINK